MHRLCTSSGCSIPALEAETGTRMSTEDKDECFYFKKKKRKKEKKERKKIMIIILMIKSTNGKVISIN